MLGGLTGLDSASCAQTMVSRPIVAGPLAGALLGDPAAGMWAGALLEILSLRQLPIGAARGWDVGPAAVAAVAASSLWATGPVGLAVGVGFGVLVGELGGWTVHRMRHFNARLVANPDQPLQTVSRLSIRHLSAVLGDLLRATLLTAVAVLGFAALTRLLAGAAGGPGVTAAALLVLAAASLGLGVDLRMMARGRRVWAAAAAGAALGLGFALWLG